MNRYVALIKFLRERAQSPFVWGANDCCVFAADAVLAQTGRDPMGGIRGSYETEQHAENMLENYPGGLEKIATDRLGPPYARVTTAQRGDVILFESGSGPALGVCVGEKFAAVKPDGGVGYFSMRHAVTAWRVE